MFGPRQFGHDLDFVPVEAVDASRDEVRVDPAYLLPATDSGRAIVEESKALKRTRKVP